MASDPDKIIETVIQICNYFGNCSHLKEKVLTSYQNCTYRVYVLIYNHIIKSERRKWKE